MNRRTVITIITAVTLVGVAIVTTRPLPLGQAYACVLLAAFVGVFGGAFLGTVVVEFWPSRHRRPPWWRW